ncbi:META domain-containing protein [Yoonia sp.]|uniref:META domain-containing protein n=1 Tax=Yoonia sp. TaxID=2212373 RepID=UPI002FDB58B7
MKRFMSTIAATVFGATAIFAQQDDAYVGAHGASTPDTYLGAVDDQSWHLDLWPDQAFHLVRTPVGGGQPVVSAGRWHADGRNIHLQTGDDVVTLQVRNAGRLRPDGAPDDASADLVGQDGLDPAELSLPVSGMFTYFADAAIFVHCATGRMYPVAQEADYLATERAYLADQTGPAEPLFVTLDATIAVRPQMEGPDRPTVIVDAFTATWAGEDCARAAAAPTLAGTVWQIRSLGSDPLAWTPPAREPYVVLDAEEARFNASVGCNTILGSYTAGEGTVSFGQPASTMMACPDDLAASEARLIAALEATSGHLIGGRTLHLVGENGSVLATLEAVYLP